MEMSNTTVYTIGGVLIVLFLLLIRWKLKKTCVTEKEPSISCVPCDNPTLLVHRLCPHNNVIQSFEVEQKDSLDEHLNVLTKKLAEKEGRLRLSKSKIRETQHEIENLQAIDQDVRQRYREIMENLKSDLLNNEHECKKLQDQIEWVSTRRAELRDEVRRGQRLYGEAAAELASNLAELQRGRIVVTDKPNPLECSMRHRKEPHLPRAPPLGTMSIKTPASTPEGFHSHTTSFN